VGRELQPEWERNGRVGVDWVYFSQERTLLRHAGAYVITHFVRRKRNPLVQAQAAKLPRHAQRTDPPIAHLEVLALSIRHDPQGLHDGDLAIVLTSQDLRV
jgi:hypothetical protein